MSVSRTCMQCLNEGTWLDYVQLKQTACHCSRSSPCWKRLIGEKETLKNVCVLLSTRGRESVSTCSMADINLAGFAVAVILTAWDWSRLLKFRKPTRRPMQWVLSHCMMLMMMGKSILVPLNFRKAYFLADARGTRVETMSTPITASIGERILRAACMTKLTPRRMGYVARSASDRRSI